MIVPGGLIVFWLLFLVMMLRPTRQPCDTSSLIERGSWAGPAFPQPHLHRHQPPSPERPQLVIKDSCQLRLFPSFPHHVPMGAYFDGRWLQSCPVLAFGRHTVLSALPLSRQCYIVRKHSRKFMTTRTYKVH